MSCFTRSKTTLCQPSKKDVKLHFRDSNQGPSAYRADALTAALWCSSHPQRCKYDINPNLLALTGNSHQSGGLSATNYYVECNIVSQTAKLANIRLKKTNSKM